MDAFITLLVFAVFFYVMMRFGCGAHLIHGDQCHHDKKDVNHKEANNIDPICGKTVKSDEGYSLMYQHYLQRFCSRRCLDTFEANPGKYTSKTSEMSTT